MNNGPTVTDHEQELGVGELLAEVHSGLEGEWVFVAEARRGHSVLGDDLQDESPHGRVHHLVGDPGLFQSLLLHRRFLPLRTHAQNTRDDARLLPAPDVRVGVHHDPHEGCAAPRHPAHEDERHVIAVSNGLVLLVVDDPLFLGHHDDAWPRVAGEGAVHDVEAAQGGKEHDSPLTQACSEDAHASHKVFPAAGVFRHADTAITYQTGDSHSGTDMMDAQLARQWSDGLHTGVLDIIDCGGWRVAVMWWGLEDVTLCPTLVAGHWTAAGISEGKT